MNGNLMVTASKRIKKTGRRISLSSSTFWVCIVAFIGFILLRNLGEVNLPDLIVVAISAVVFLFLPIEDGMVFYALLIPFKTGIGMHSITLVFCVAAFLRHMRRTGGKFRMPIMALAIILVLEVINMAIGQGDYPELLRYAVYLLWMYFIYEQLNSLHWDKKVITNIMKAFVGGLVIASLIVVIINGQNLTLAGLFNGQFRIGKTAEYSSLDSMLISFHVNDLAIFCASGISLLVILTLNKHVNAVIGMAGITYLLLVGFLTQSRTFVLMIALLVVYLALVSGKNRWLYLLAIGIVTVVVLCLYKAGHLPVIDAILSRFNATDMETMNGRTDIISAYNEVIFSNPIRLLTGYGVLDYRLYSTVGSAHNGSQEMLVSCGLIGSFCLIYWYYFFGKTAQRRAGCRLRKNLINYAPLLTVLLGIQGTQFVSQYHMFCIFIFSMIAIGLGECQDKATLR